jgi:hypothetical protein
MLTTQDGILPGGIGLTVTTYDALLIFLLFLPGLLSQRIVEFLTPRQERGEFERLIDAAALSLAIFLLYLVVAGVFGLPKVPVAYTPAVTVDSVTTAAKLEVRWQSALAIFLLSAFVGALLGKWIGNGRLYYLLGASVASCKYMI